MSTGAISQLVSRGHINKFLNDSPQISFWRFQSMRHTHFALESQLVQFQGTGIVGSTNTVRLSRSGDLVYHCYAVIDLPGIANVTTTTTVKGSTVDSSSGHYAEAVETGLAAQYRAMGGGKAKCFAESNTAAAPASVRTVAGVQDKEYANQAVPYYTQACGQYLIQKATVMIGSQPIDTLYSDYMFMLEELEGKPGKELKDMIHKQDTVAELKLRSKMFQRLYVPIPWFFTTQSGNALPLVSLQFHDVRIEITWNAITDAICNSSGLTGKGTITIYEDPTASPLVPRTLRTVVRPLENSLNQRKYGAISVWGDGTNDTNSTLPPAISNSDVSCQLEVCYVFLGKQERQRFAEGSFEMLISEVQQISPLTGQQSSSVVASLDFNHAIYELLWCVKQAYHEQLNNHFEFGGLVEPLTSITLDPIESVMIKINNQERVYSTEGRYYRLVQPYQHHDRVPKQFVYSYSFALHPGDQQPSGSCNFSRIDNSKLDVTVDKYLFRSNVAQGGLNLGSTDVTDIDGSTVRKPLVSGGNSLTLKAYGRNFNVLRITLGLAGKAFAN